MSSSIDLEISESSYGFAKNTYLSLYCAENALSITSLFSRFPLTNITIFQASSAILPLRSQPEGSSTEFVSLISVIMISELAIISVSSGLGVFALVSNTLESLNHIFPITLLTISR